ncbi:exported protein of unknown function [Nitrospira moscoviensis]|uniref:Uncharacterized protein n=1 Tax=Nitrospira moscoviensis TaxID=42253 RepID=A0A0K2GC58_NITMO|nr:exported protein of unknown function [Nitrospira moscoviensis]
MGKPVTGALAPSCAHAVADATTKAIPNKHHNATQLALALVRLFIATTCASLLHPRPSDYHLGVRLCRLSETFSVGKSRETMYR